MKVVKWDQNEATLNKFRIIKIKLCRFKKNNVNCTQLI